MTYMHDTLKKRQDEALTWLARNVHEWPATTIDTKRQDNLFWIDPEKNNIKAVIDSSQFNVFTKEQWLTRRAELQNKPNWSEVESDAEWMAQRPDGRWWLLNCKPSVLPGGGGWWKFDGLYAWLSQNPGEVLGDWRDTLEHRPQAAKSEPSSDDWHKRGELPPIGVCVLKKYKNNDCWHEVTIAGAGNQLVIFRYPDGIEVVGEWHEYDFRPLQTERERVASELVDVMMAVPVSDRKTASESYMSIALAIYDHLHQESRV